MSVHTPGHPGLARALHPRFSDPEIVARLARTWRDTGALCVESALAPGLCAELAALVPQLALAPTWDGARTQLSWRCQVAMPDNLEPQYPACLYRVGHLVHHELPRLVSAITGRAFTTPEPRYIDVHVLRKGSFRDPGRDTERAPQSLDAILGLTGAQWPDAWGGHLRWGPDASPVRLGWDTLHLGPVAELHIPLLTHHVYGAAIMTMLAPAPEEPADAASEPP